MWRIMSVKDLYLSSDALGLAERVKAGDVSPRELVDVAIECIEDVNPLLNAVVSTRYDYARERAECEPAEGPFAGVPFLLKDLSIEWEGFPVSNGSAFFKDNIAAKSWTHAERLQRAGLIPLGKTNVPEMGYCTSTEPKLFGPTINPWHPDSVAGGSSGGAAAAVASRMVPIADASDGGGSIRIPASLNGLVGLKPSRGRTTYAPDLVDFWYGAVSFLCLSRTVRDSAAYLDVVAGASPGDPYALPTPEQPYLSLLSGNPCPTLDIAFVTGTPDGSPLGPEQRAAVDNAAKACAALGHRVTETDFDYAFEPMMLLFDRLTAVSTASYYDWYGTKIGRAVTQADVENATWEVIAQGRALSAGQHFQDIEAMRLFARNFIGKFDRYDVVISPTLMRDPLPRGHLDMALDLHTFRTRMRPDIAFTGPYNFSGQPAISLPLHQTADGKPIGVQFAARIGDEAALIGLAGQLEQALPWHDRRPAIIAA